MDITITSRYELLKKLQEQSYHALISINDPEDTVPQGIEYVHTGSIKPLFFHDITEDIDAHVSPSEDIVKEIVDYTRNEYFSKGATRLLVHCHAGISRSSASAIIAAASVGISPSSFVDLMYSKSGIYHPNYRLLELAEGVLSLKGFFNEARDRINVHLNGEWFDGNNNLDYKGKWYSGKKE